MQFKNIIRFALSILFIGSAIHVAAQVAENNFNSSIAFKVPGNNAVHYPLQDITRENVTRLTADRVIPVDITRAIKSPTSEAHRVIGQNSAGRDYSPADQVM